MEAEKAPRGVKLTEPQYDLLSFMGSTDYGQELHFVNGERGRKTIEIGNEPNRRKFQVRTAEALLEAGLIEDSETINPNRPVNPIGRIDRVCRLTAKGWNALGVPVREAPAALKEKVRVADLEVIGDENDKAADYEDAEALQVRRVGKHARGSTRPYDFDKRKKKRRKMEKASRRINRRG